MKILGNYRENPGVRQPSKSKQGTTELEKIDMLHFIAFKLKK